MEKSVSADAENHLKKPGGSGAPDLSLRRMLLLGALFVGLTFLGAYAVYSQVAGNTLEWDPRLISPRLLAGSAVLLLLYFSADGLRLWFTLRALGQSVRPAAMARLVFMNIFISNITPLATGGGVVQVWFLRRTGVHVGTGMTATTIRTALAVMFIFVSAPVLLVSLPKAEDAIAGRSIIIPVLVMVTLYLGGLTLLILGSAILQGLLHRLIGLLQKMHLISPQRCEGWRKRSSRELRRFSLGFRRYFRGSIMDIGGSILCTALFLLSLFSFPALLLWNLGYDFSYWTVIGRMLFTTFLMYFSPTPGASGIAEGVFGRLFADIVTAGHLVLVTVAWRTLTIYLGMGIGLFMTHRELTRAPAETGE